MARPKKNTSSTSSKNEGVDFSITNAFQAFLSDTTDIIASTTDDFLKIPSGLDIIDAITGGGIPCRFSVYMGKPGAGKSSLLVNYIKNGQKLWGDKFIAVYCDSEESMTQKRFKDFGCTMDVNIVNGLTVEKLFKTVEALCLFKSQNKEYLEIPSMIVWDSIANTMTEKVMDNEDLSNTDGAVRAGILARLLPKYADKLTKYNIALVAVNQYRVKMAMGGGPVAADMRGMKQDQTYPGGQAVGFNAFQLFDVEQGPLYKDDPYGYPMAPVKVRAIKNKAFSPNIPVEINFNHHRGFSNFWTNYEFLKKQKYITAGAHCRLNSMPTVSFRQKQASSLYVTNPDWKEAFDADLKDALDKFIEEHSGGDIDGIYWDPDERTVEKAPTTLTWVENRDKNEQKKKGGFDLTKAMGEVEEKDPFDKIKNVPGNPFEGIDIDNAINMLSEKMNFEDGEPEDLEEEVIFDV